MRRILAIAVPLLLVIGVTAAHPSEISASIGRVSATQAIILADGTITSPADVTFEWGTTAGGTTGSVAVPLSTSTRRLVKRLRVVKITAALLATDGDDAAFPDARRGAKLFWRG